MEFKTLKVYFVVNFNLQSEMAVLQDKDLEQEVKLLNKLNEYDD